MHIVFTYLLSRWASLHWGLRGWEKKLREYLKFDFHKAVFAHNRNPVEQRVAGGGKEDIQGVLDYIEDLGAGVVRKS